MGKLEIIIGNDKYPGLELPAEASTVGSWKDLVAKGCLGEKVLYAQKLTCHGAEHRVLEEASSMPVPPTPMRVSGPRSILGMFEMALRKKVGSPKAVEVHRIQPPPKKKKSGWPWVGKYHVIRTIGSGFMGPCVYEAENLVDHKKVALKWPAAREELAVLKAINAKHPDGCAGMPKLLDSGRYENKPYLIMHEFRLSLQNFFPRIWSKPRDDRWYATCILGRLLLRRLEALHDCGFVHCDLSPENVLLGRLGSMDFDPHLVDFGLARAYPGGGKLGGEHGSGEWSSIRSADGGERRPEDDLEALGWVMMNCMFSVLPWFAVLEIAYKNWHGAPTRDAAVQQVQIMKRTFLHEGWQATAQWSAGQPTPPEDLLRFILASQTLVEPPLRPDYTYLAGLLKATPGLDAAAAEEEDLRLWHKEFAVDT